MLDPELSQIAAEWHTRIAENPQRRESLQFRQWIAIAEHREAFDCVSAAWKRVGELAELPAMARWRSRVLGEALEAAAHRRHRKWAGLTAFAALVCCAVLSAVLVFRPEQHIYRANVGERRLVTLSDASRLWLDSQTSVRVSYTAHARTLELLQGRARFDVTHDARRPFAVTAGNSTVVAVGTSFNVELLPSAVLVTLTEGQVLVSADQRIGQPDGHAIALAAGQQLTAFRRGTVVVRQIDLNTANAWEAGKLVFDDIPLSEAIARINRYENRPIRLDPLIVGLRISGVFEANRPDAFVHAVVNYFRLQAVRSADGRTYLMPPAAKTRGCGRGSDRCRDAR